MKPIIIAPVTVTNPDAGVIAIKPVIAPEIAPNIVGLPVFIISIITHDIKAAAAAAMFVTRNADPASPPAERADPALNPNQPNHRRPVPIME